MTKATLGTLICLLAGAAMLAGCTAKSTLLSSKALVDAPVTFERATIQLQTYPTWGDRHRKQVAGAVKKALGKHGVEADYVILTEETLNPERLVEDAATQNASTHILAVAQVSEQYNPDLLGRSNANWDSRLLQFACTLEACGSREVVWKGVVQVDPADYGLVNGLDSVGGALASGIEKELVKLGFLTPVAEKRGPHGD